MPKKLLMSNCYYYSENGLMPVMDGLICWLDARDIKTGDTTWKDRSSSNYAFEIVGSPVIENGYFYFDLSKPYARCASLKIDINSVTVQCSLKNMGLGNNSYIWSIKGYERGINLVLGKTKDVLEFVASPPRTFVQANTFVCSRESYITTSSSEYSQSFRSEGVFDVKRNFTSSIAWSISGMEIGKECNYGGGGGFDGCMGSLLVYNRILTEEEIQQNYLYEQSIERG